MTKVALKSVLQNTFKSNCPSRICCVGVAVKVLVGVGEGPVVLVAVGVEVCVRVDVAVLVGVMVRVGVGVRVFVGVLVTVGVFVIVGVGEGPSVLVGVGVRVGVKVRVLVGVGEGPGVMVEVAVGVFVGVLVGFGVLVAVLVGVAVLVAVGKAVLVGVGVGVFVGSGRQVPVAPRLTCSSWEVAYWTLTVAFPAVLKEMLSFAPRLKEMLCGVCPGSLMVYVPPFMSPPIFVMVNVADKSRLQATPNPR